LKSRHDLNSKAKQTPKYGNLWLEFDESLVISSDGEKLYNSLDASHFFNTYNLARGLTENRLLAAVPGFLTAIGVIGTFVGLQMGLKSIVLDGGPDAMIEGIREMISGASIAFLTSVWGVASSVIFNIIEKNLERGIRLRISNLQNKIDYLYPRINAEGSLERIADYSQTSMSTLQGLAEKIGDRMQEALLEATDAIGSNLNDSLNKIMAPAIENLVSNANEGSQNALETLIGRFVDKVEQAGESQRDLMESTSKEANQTFTQLGQQMDSFLARLETQAERSEKAETKKHEQLEQLLQNLGSGLQQEVIKVADQNNELIEGIGTNITTQLSEISRLDQERQNDFTENVKGMAGLNKRLIDMTQHREESQEKSFSVLQEQVRELVDRLDLSAKANAQYAEAINQSSQQMQGASNQLGLLSSNVKQAAESLSSKISKAVETTSLLADQNIEVRDELQNALKGFENVKDGLGVVVESLSVATKHAESGFSAVDQHLESFQKALINNVKDLEEQISELLTNYTDQVQGQTVERLNEWNKQTQEFSSGMLDTVKALQSVIDDMDVQVGRHN
jgi:hypothetical protein